MKTALLFGSSMILQRDKVIPVWGEACPGECITVKIQRQIKKTTTDQNGKWSVNLDPLRVSFYETMEVSGDTDSWVFDNVAVGDVWLAGGQSNMEFFMRYDKDFSCSYETCENPNIRFFDYPEIAYEGEEKDFDYSLFGFWRECTKENLQYFSAVGYYFAKNLQCSLNIPVGIIGCNWGGTRAVCWMDENSAQQYAGIWLEDYEKALKNIPDQEAYIRSYRANKMNDRTHPFDNDFTDRCMYGVSFEEMKHILSEVFSSGDAIQEVGPCHEWRPCGLYHTMLQKTAPYGISGFLWYQGESDTIHAEIYEDVMYGLITSWRNLWKEDLPFIQTQLAPMDCVLDETARYYPMIRQCQQSVTNCLDKVWCVTAGDVGNKYDIHPKEKQPIGKRMALIALGYVYGMDIECESPAYSFFEKDGSSILIHFDFGEGLHRINDRQLPLILTTDKGNLLEEPEVKVDFKDNRMIIQLPEQKLNCVQTIGFGYTPYYEMNVYNRAGIPVKPFMIQMN